MSNSRNSSPFCSARFLRNSSNVCFQAWAWTTAVLVSTPSRSKRQAVIWDGSLIRSRALTMRGTLTGTVRGLVKMDGRRGRGAGPQQRRDVEDDRDAAAVGGFVDVARLLDDPLFGLQASGLAGADRPHLARVLIGLALPDDGAALT